MAWFLGQLPPDARILDVGCADGWFARAAAERGFTNVVGIDVEPPADIVGDVRRWADLGLHAHSFDAVVAFEVIEHGDFTTTFWELLKPGGALCITTPVPHMDGACEFLERAHLLQQRGGPHTNLTDLRTLKGFEVERYERKALVSQWGLLRALPEAAAAQHAPPAHGSRWTRAIVARRHRRVAPVASSIYDEQYFLSNACEGLPEYLAGDLSILRRRELEHLDVRPGHIVLDLGCGRGETSLELARRSTCVVAVDYAADAVRMTAKLLDIDGRSRVARADAARLPFADASFDRILLGDVIEHLPWSAAVEAVREVSRVLRPGGRAVIHTSPNTWFIRTVKPVIVATMRVMGRTEVVARFAEYDRLRGPMHPNELSPLRLPKLLRRAGVEGRTWVDPDVLRSGNSEWTAGLSASRIVRVAARVVGSMPLRLVFGNDLYAVVEASSPAGGGSPK